MKQKRFSINYVRQESITQDKMQKIEKYTRLLEENKS